MGHILDWHNLAPCDNDKDTHGSADFGIELIPSKERASTAYMGGRCVMAYEMNHHTVSTLILNTTKHTFQFFVHFFFIPQKLFIQHNLVDRWIQYQHRYRCCQYLDLSVHLQYGAFPLYIIWELLSALTNNYD